MLSNTTLLHYRNYGKQIIKNYRKKTPTKLEYIQNNVPTFREFVESILNEKVTSMNPHWMPIYNECMPCHINYTIIGR